MRPQNIGPTINQRLLLGYEKTLIACGSYILEIVAVSFLCNTGIWSRKILKRGSGGQGDEAVDLQCTRGSRGSLQGPRGSRGRPTGRHFA